MNDFSDLKAAFPMIFKKPIAFHACFADIAGGALPGLMLSQACYWTSVLDEARDGWFYKSQEEWECETRMTRWEQETSRKQLRRRGLLEERRSGVPARLYYRVKFEKVWSDLAQTSLWENHNLDCGKASFKNDGKPQSLLLTETTTETTSEKKSGKAAAFVPPTQVEVAGYMRQRGIAEAEHQAELFVAHHAERHWKLSGGRGPKMTDWHRAVVTWQGYMGKFTGGHNGQSGTESFAERESRRAAEAIENVLGRYEAPSGDLPRALPPADD